MDEQFFFLYQLKVSRNDFYSYPILERKNMVSRFIAQKEKENEAIERARKK